MKRLIAATALAALLTACGGGGGSSTLPAAGGSTAGKTSSHGNVSFVIKIPPKPTGATANNRKSPQWITSSVQGVSIGVTQDPATTTSGSVFYPLTNAQSYCASSTSGLTCTLALDAPAGKDIFTVETFDTPNYTGPDYWDSVISEGSVEANIVSGQANTISVVTGGVVSGLLANVDNAYPATGAGATIPVRTLAVDFDGNVIVGPFDTALTASDSDTSGATKLSATSIPSSQVLNTLSIAYNGSALSTPAQITVQSVSPYSATYSGTPPTATFSLIPGATGLTVTPSVLYFASPTAPAQSFTVTGGTGPYSWNGDACFIFSSASGTGCVGAVTPSGGTFSLTGATAGSWGWSLLDLYTVQDSAAHTATVQIYMVGPNPGATTYPIGCTAPTSSSRRMTGSASRVKTMGSCMTPPPTPTPAP